MMQCFLELPKKGRKRGHCGKVEVVVYSSRWAMYRGEYRRHVYSGGCVKFLPHVAHYVTLDRKDRIPPTIFFDRAHIGAGTVTHELFHAVLAAYPRHRTRYEEECAAEAITKLTQDFWNWWYGENAETRD